MFLFEVVVSNEFLSPTKRNSIFIRMDQRIFLGEIRNNLKT